MAESKSEIADSKANPRRLSNLVASLGEKR
jgi:hypothetical protein